MLKESAGGSGAGVAGVSSYRGQPRRSRQAMPGFWFGLVMIILLGIGALTLHRYDVWRVLIWIAFGWFVLGALLLAYRGEQL